MKCKNRECKRPKKSHRHNYCSDACKDREQYLRKLDRKGKVPTKGRYLEKTKVKLVTKVEVKEKPVSKSKMSAAWLQTAWENRVTA